MLQVAAGSYAPEAYHDFIGFEVSKQLLDRAFLETYGLKMKDLFLDEDLTIGTYRYAVSQAIPQMTNVAWRQKHDLIDKAAPGAHAPAVRLQPDASGVREAVRRAIQEARTC